MLLFAELFNPFSAEIFRDLMSSFISVIYQLWLILSKAVAEIRCSSCVSLFLSDSACYQQVSSLILNHHLINHLIISLTLTPLQCYFNTIWSGTKYTLSSVDLTLGILLCSQCVLYVEFYLR